MRFPVTITLLALIVLFLLIGVEGFIKLGLFFTFGVPVLMGIAFVIFVVAAAINGKRD